ncbi:unnamed protein product [Rhizophagus irregularis]|nr:unnamed protein product [Rhizophagus irregularis]CAB5386250.1 unnamed protein product [Rhizophagus irregularis]
MVRSTTKALLSKISIFVRKYLPKNIVPPKVKDDRITKYEERLKVVSRSLTSFIISLPLIGNRRDGRKLFNHKTS